MTTRADIVWSVDPDGAGSRYGDFVLFVSSRHADRGCWHFYILNKGIIMRFGTAASEADAKDRASELLMDIIEPKAYTLTIWQLDGKRIRLDSLIEQLAEGVPEELWLYKKVRLDLPRHLLTSKDKDQLLEEVRQLSQLFWDHTFRLELGNKVWVFRSGKES